MQHNTVPLSNSTQSSPQTDLVFKSKLRRARTRNSLAKVYYCAFFVLAYIALAGCETTNTATSTSFIKKYEARRDVEKLVEVVQQGNKRERVTAIESLGNIRDPRAVATLSVALKSNSWVEREAAAKALGKIKDYLVIKPLLSVLNDEAQFVRESALKGLNDTVESMSKTKDIRFYKPLINGLRGAI